MDRYALVISMHMTNTSYAIFIHANHNLNVKKMHELFISTFAYSLPAYVLMTLYSKQSKQLQLWHKCVITVQQTFITVLRLRE